MTAQLRHLSSLLRAIPKAKAEVPGLEYFTAAEMIAPPARPVAADCAEVQVLDAMYGYYAPQG